MASFQEIVEKTFSHLCMGKSRLGRKISEINKRVGDNIFEKNKICCTIIRQVRVASCFRKYAIVYLSTTDYIIWRIKVENAKFILWSGSVIWRFFHSRVKHQIWSRLALFKIFSFVIKLGDKRRRRRLHIGCPCYGPFWWNL